MEIKSEPCEDIPAAAAPSFFKIMFGDFSTALLIPPAFAKHLHLVFPQEFVLATTHDGKRWHITVIKVDNKFYFETGWHKFVQDKSIHLGDFLVFSYVDKLEFNVKIFKRTGCEEVDDKATCEEADTATDDEIQAMHNDSDGTEDQIDASNSPHNQFGKEIVQSYQDKLKHQHAKAEEAVVHGEGSSVAVADNFSSNYPFFKVILTHTYAGKSGFVHIPMSFGEQHLDLVSKRILLQDNSLQAKDVCIFELVEGNSIVMKVSIIRSIAKVSNKLFGRGSLPHLG